MTTATMNLEEVGVVLKGNGFDADGLHRERGEVLPITGWRNVQALINTRALSTAPYNLAETMTECECGRRWVNQEASARHACPARQKAEAETPGPTASAKKTRAPKES